MNLEIEKIGVKIKIIEEKNLKAIIGLDFGDFVVKGFRIKESEFENRNGEKLWLTPPSYSGGAKWHPIFFMPDKTLWEQLEDKIYAEYNKQSKEYFKKRLGVEDDEFP